MEHIKPLDTDALEMTFTHWKEEGDGRPDRMISMQNRETAKLVGSALYGDVYFHFEHFLLNTSIEPNCLQEISLCVYAYIDYFGTYDLSALARSIATVLMQKFPETTFLVRIIDELEDAYRQYITEEKGEIYIPSPKCLPDTVSFPKFIEKILRVYHL